MSVKLLNPDATVPTRGSDEAAGYDLYSLYPLKINPCERVVVSTGIAMKIPVGTYGRVAPRSGLALKNGIDVLAGVIDADYRGEIKVILINHDSKVVEFPAQSKIAQLIFEKIETPELEVVENLDDTNRGEGGFGSTG
jgi:dUTP pyrophosphatase